jgi:TetR/AcrR family transcriptional repressor of nem operon
MSEIADAIMDSAERRIRMGGFSGFSFREIASDVGVKSSSVHYHFPTKEALAAAVIHRYTDHVADLMDKEYAADQNTLKIWTRAFRGTLHTSEMCPATVMGAAVGDLPKEVAAEVQRFFKMCLTKMVKQGLTEKQAAEFLSTITGALVVASSMDDKSLYDRATTELVKATLASKRGSKGADEKAGRKSERGRRES